MYIGNTRIGGIGSLSVKNTYDPDALAYLTAVETADGQALENSVKIAVNTFVVGCKADGIWDAIVASCIMAGARSVAGAVVPLKGNAPTNNNFVSGDYSRKLGLLGNDTDKYLATGYYNSDTTNFPQNDSHISCYISTTQTDSNGVLVGGINSIGNRLSLHYTSTTNIATRNRSGSASTITLAPSGFQGNTRNNSANFTRRFTTTAGISESVVTGTSGTPSIELLGVFASGSATLFSSARMSFYSIGTSLTLSSLDSRITTLMTTLNALL
jgi:hypothetical protein